MRPKCPLIMLTAFILASLHLAHTQQPKKVARIGWLAPGSPSDVALLTGAFRPGLRDLGYVKGKNTAIENWAMSFSKLLHLWERGKR